MADRDQGKHKRKDELDEFVEFVSAMIPHEVQRALLTSKAEGFLKPKLAKLAYSENEAKQLQLKVDRLTETLGGHPNKDFWIIFHDQPLEVYDTYINSCLSEINNGFHKSRKTVRSAHITLVTENTIKTYPADVLGLDEEGARLLTKQLADRYWTEVEISYVLLASYWDRVGQLFDFVFFHIRQYERDGFDAVMERIRVNHIRLSEALSSSLAWRRLRGFQKSEKKDGLRWLLRRRNLIVHRLGMETDTEPHEERVFDRRYDHLFEAAKHKLSREDQLGEIDNLHLHLRTISELFPHVIDLAQQGALLVPRPG